MDKKQEIIRIIKKYRDTEFIDIGAEEILSLFDFIPVSEQSPPIETELLAKSPSGVVHLCSWRPAYNIFTCQSKSESSFDWSWKLIN